MRYYISRDIGRNDQPCDRLSLLTTNRAVFSTNGFMVFNSVEDAAIAAKQVSNMHRDQAWDNACHYTVRVIDPIEVLPGTNIVAPEHDQWVRENWATAAYPVQLRLRVADVCMLSRHRPIVVGDLCHYSGRETHEIVDTVSCHCNPAKQPAPVVQRSLFQRLASVLA